MNPITNIRSRQKQREQEVVLGLSDKASYHNCYKSSAYIYAGQLSFKLTEGDLLAIFSEYGEVVDVNLVRFAPASGLVLAPGLKRSHFTRTATLQTFVRPQQG
jgi:hypothetical protein